MLLLEKPDFNLSLIQFYYQGDLWRRQLAVIFT
ncbi:hypothetical protein EHW99_0316 [Erwinia amylovora]|uniref:Uncharacterized protein n=3 Tax=Erwinia amylovora TaxID=552 RepID=A0A831A7W6_ERWAM|nr:hypothetical protein EaACW_3325 [Erwinia amylovora ACW56400]QJQ53023.1 hypothetical protein EHX00_0316 [Erwinia amylovora]CBA23407.1 hypothetical protein predicted by Glimmer/Critica [Erwinia amylovora CFBP1430]CBX82185.1 hypothetical protein predicted by Glimmer/Critica [Erwinia amylovora ATCC BAA-2158]CCO80163.1 hypothetical protein BN432_3393 [Erwinia amylovora Ea356]CCO83967.1 hypothetical protein BN433_3419 [Erwinia amylovora Ea266]CCO87729.1 hypothetical protein BN434_3369 [Erwinia a